MGTDRQRMFRVVVLGGVALTAGAVAVTAVGCGGSDGDGQMPTEGPSGDAFVYESAAPDSFPHEGTDTYLPHEGPAFVDSSADTSEGGVTDGSTDGTTDAGETDAAETDAGDTTSRE